MKLEPSRYMRIPFFVTGYCVTEENMEAIAKWCGGYVIREDDKPPFIHVPVARATSDKQYKAYVGTHVVVSVQRGERSFKVYTDEWLLKQFMPITVETFDEDGIDDFETRTGTTREIHIPQNNRVAGNRRPVPAQFQPPTSNTKSPTT